MKKSLLILFTVFCIGVIKAHFLPHNFRSLKPHIEIRYINALPDYNVTFKFHGYYKLPIPVFSKVPFTPNKLAILGPFVSLPKVNLPVCRNGFAEGIFMDNETKV